MKIFFIEPYYTAYYFDDGRIKFESASTLKKGKELTIWKNKLGYLMVKLGNKSKQVHQIVASHFMGQPLTGYVVNHKDGNKVNNSLKNLEYVTVGENVKHAIKIGLHVSSDITGRRMPKYKDGRTMGNKRKGYKHEWYIRNKLRTAYAIKESVKPLVSI